MTMQDFVAVSQWECRHDGLGAMGIGQWELVTADNSERQTGRQIMLFSQAVNIYFLIQSVSSVIWILTSFVSQTSYTYSQN